MNVETLVECPQEHQEQFKETVFKCPTGKFIVKYDPSGEGNLLINDIIFEQTLNIEKNKLNESVSISLKEYLPAGWVFEQSKCFQADSDRRRINFPEGGLSLNKSLTTLLHEIGHARTYEYHRKNGTFEKYKAPDNAYRRERDAWANALQIIRKLMKKGMVAEEVWRNHQTLLNFVYTALSAGERGLDHRYIKGQTFQPVDMSDIDAVDDAEWKQKVDELFKEIEERRERREQLKRENKW